MCYPPDVEDDYLPRPVRILGWVIAAGAVVYALAHAVVAWIT